MEELFVVSFEEVGGSIELFGTFESFKDAYKWMQTDFERNVMRLELDKIKVESTVTEDAMTIKGCGKWKVYRLTKASPIF